jgi:hypothetical protein
MAPCRKPGADIQPIQGEGATVLFNPEARVK